MLYNLVFSATRRPPYPVLVGAPALAGRLQPAPVGLGVEGPGSTFGVLKTFAGAVQRSCRLQCFATGCVAASSNVFSLVHGASWGQNLSFARKCKKMVWVTNQAQCTGTLRLVS